MANKSHTYRGHRGDFRRDEGHKPGHSSYDHNQFAQPHNKNFEARDFSADKGSMTEQHKIHMSPVSHSRSDVDGEKFAMNGCKPTSIVNGGTSAATTDNWHSSTSGAGDELVSRKGSAYHGSSGLKGSGEFTYARGYGKK